VPKLPASTVASPNLGFELFHSNLLMRFELSANDKDAFWVQKLENASEPLRLQSSAVAESLLASQ